MHHTIDSEFSAAINIETFFLIVTDNMSIDINYYAIETK